MITRRSMLLTGAAAVVAAAGSGCARSSDRSFGVSITGSDAESVGFAERFGEQLGRTPDIVNLFMAWEYQQQFPAACLDAIRELGAKPEITWEPWNPNAGAAQRKYRLSSVRSYEAYVDTWARAARDYGHAVYLRFAHEMNSHWYPWSAAANGGTPAAYVDAFRWVHRRFVDAGASNVRWVWCPNVVYNDRPDIVEKTYPGDEFVDVVAVDGYDLGGRSPEQVFGDTLALLGRIAPGKPLWVNETGSVPGEGKAEWIASLFAYLATTRVSCVTWFEIARPDRPDWTLLSTPDTADAARRSLTHW